MDDKTIDFPRQRVSDEERERIRALANGIFEIHRKQTRLRLKPVPAALILAAVTYGAIHLSWSMSPITAREGIILDTMIDRASAEGHESQATIWNRIEKATGAADTTAISERQYPVALGVVADKIERARLK